MALTPQQQATVDQLNDEIDRYQSDTANYVQPNLEDAKIGLSLAQAGDNKAGIAKYSGIISQLNNQLAANQQSIAKAQTNIDSVNNAPAVSDPSLQNTAPPSPPSVTNDDGSTNSQQVTNSGAVIQTSNTAEGTTTVITNPDGSITTETVVATETVATESAVNPPIIDSGAADGVNTWQAEVNRTQAETTTPVKSKPPFGATADTPAPATASWGPAKDLRVKLRIPNEYMQAGSPGAGPSNILQQNGGILFPYTPTINMDNKAEYAANSPLHSNYAQYFFKHSMVGPISITAKFTVQNEYEGAVLLGVIHLLRGLTKMKWGNDPDAGAPPPVCRLDAYGDAMLYNVPVSVASWRHDLPDNVDYITVGRPGSSTIYGHSLVPSLSTIQITLNVMYSRQEQLAFNVKQWNSGALKYKGYL